MIQFIELLTCWWKRGHINKTRRPLAFGLTWHFRQFFYCLSWPHFFTLPLVLFPVFFYRIFTAFANCLAGAISSHFFFFFGVWVKKLTWSKMWKSRKGKAHSHIHITTFIYFCQSTFHTLDRRAHMHAMGDCGSSNSLQNQEQNEYPHWKGK